MRRNNMVQQFIGEPDPLSEGTDAEDLGYDEVDFTITGGKLSIVVPSGTPDDEIWNEPRVVMVEVVTEDGQTYQFEVNHGGDTMIL